MGELLADGLVAVAVVGRPRGLRGELRVHLHEAGSDVLLRTPKVVLAPRAAPPVELQVERIDLQGRVAVVRFAGVADRTAAERLTGARVMVERALLPLPGEDEYYDADLVGLELRDVEGAAIGRVVAVEHPPSVDVLTVELRAGGYVDVPMIASVLKRVDLEGGVAEVDMPDGLPTRPRP